ncbi:MAG: hypothetical protein J3T61_03240 [Candidatus Brocadiales bacterium]|nr:hypothetical protein [Candidatus Bathyanammoxibius sp.]
MNSMIQVLKDAIHDLGRIGKPYGPTDAGDWWDTVKHEVNLRLKNGTNILEKD